METSFKISGTTIPYAVLGHPVRHTLSPVMHNAAFRELGLDAAYLALDVAPDRLKHVLPAMADMGFGGVNLTVPLKEVAFKQLSDLDDYARTVGSVNTLQRADTGWRGHSTDGTGFLQAVQSDFGISVADRTVFLLGCGGAGRAVAIAMAMAGVGCLMLANRDHSRAEQLATELRTLKTNADVKVVHSASDAWEKTCCDAHLVVQATSYGMKPDEPSLLGPAAFCPGQYAFDMIYVSTETSFMAQARTAGATAVNGLSMLLYQGAKAFSIWTGREAPVSVMRQALTRAVYT